MQVVNISKKELNKNGYETLEKWLEDENNIYIGRNMSFYVKGANASKWANPFSVKKYGRDKCLEMYENYIKSNKELYNSLEELKNKKLGCWCYPLACHGNVLIDLLNKKISSPDNNHK